jgi:hypothetical protein
MLSSNLFFSVKYFIIIFLTIRKRFVHGKRFVHEKRFVSVEKQNKIIEVEKKTFFIPVIN